MKKLSNENYKGYELFFYEKNFKKLGEKIIDKDIKIVKEIKVTKRNYVVKIKYNDKYYILKSPKNEQRKIQRKIMTIFKKGEALNTFINTNYLIEEGINFLVVPYLAIVKRSNKMIEESYFVTEYLEEERREKYKKEEIEIWVKLVEKLHEKKVYHGDYNPSNIIKVKDDFKLIDTQCKKYYFGEYRSNYDKLTLEYTTYGTLGKQNWYKKSLFFFLALILKSLKNGGEKKIKGI